MADKIRRIEDRDFNEVSELYDYDEYKSIDELRWLFTDPNDPNKYNAFVAISKEDEIVGVIGYNSSLYVKKELELEGVIFMSWKVSKNYKGFIGISLLKKVSRLGDFAIAIAGSKLGQSFYPLLKYQFKSKITIYYKVLNIKSLISSLERSSLIKKIGMIVYLFPSYFFNSFLNSVYYDIELVPYDGNNFVEDKEDENIFKKKTSKNYIDWLLNCPLLNTYAFNLKQGNEYLGTCVLYINKINNVNRGRIVHLPFLGTNKKLWRSVIGKCITFFREEKCCIVTGLAHHEMVHIGYKRMGFMKIKRHDYPFYIKDYNDKLVSINIDEWSLQFSEGDKAYRNF